MSLLNDASLVMIPSGYKDGTLYSAKPTNGDGDFTFSRGSNLAATRVNSEGLIEKGRENLLLQSNSFDTWSITSGSSVTSGQSGYDGSSDAWLLTDSGNNSAYCIYRGYTNTGVQTFSIYAKQASTSQIEFDFLSGGGGYLRAELTDGSLHSTNNTIDYKIEDAGGGWWRCSFSTNHTSAPVLVRIGCNGAGSIYIQDAQVELGLVSTDVITTTTTTAQAGILEDMPRLDYSGGASCPSLLLEPQRSNLIGYSEYLEGGFSLASNSTISIENVTTPDGGNVVTKCQANLGSDNARVQDNIQIQGNNFVVSGFFKGTGDATRLRFRLNQGSGIVYDIDTSGNFTLFSEDAANDNYGIEDFGNGWYRIYFETTTSGSIDNYVQIYPDFLDGNGSVYAWGIQAEEGSYPTSYIPTYGSSSTRSNESASKTGVSSLIGQTQGTIFVEYDFDATRSNNGGSDNDIIHLRNSSGELIKIVHYGNGSGSAYKKVYLYQYKNSQYEVNISSPVQSTGRMKAAAVYRENYYALFLNGVKIGEDLNAGVPNLDLIYLNINTGFVQVTNPIHQVVLFPTALTDAECIELTTL